MPPPRMQVSISGSTSNGSSRFSIQSTSPAGPSISPSSETWRAVMIFLSDTNFLSLRWLAESPLRPGDPSVRVVYTIRPGLRAELRSVIPRVVSPNAGGIDEQVDDNANVAPHERVDEGVDDLCQLALARRPRSHLLAPLRVAALQGGPRPLKRAVDRSRTGVENPGDLTRRHVENLAKNQRRALARRKVLVRRDECEFHGLALFVASLRRGVAVLECVPIIGRRADLGFALPRAIGELV